MLDVFRSRTARWFALAVAASLAACAGHSGGILPPQSPVGMDALAPLAAPPACKGQKTTKSYATLKQKLSSKGGSLCIPAIGGFGGTILYPGANPSVDMTLTSSVTNYKHLPALGKGKAIFYLQLAISGATNFGTNAPAGGGLTSAKITAGQPYTAWGAASALGITEKFKQCYAIATKGKYGGQIGGLGTLLKGQSVPVPASAYIEIYPGKQASGKC